MPEEKRIRSLPWQSVVDDVIESGTSLPDHSSLGLHLPSKLVQCVRIGAEEATFHPNPLKSSGRS